MSYTVLVTGSSSLDRITLIHFALESGLIGCQALFGEKPTALQLGTHRGVEKSVRRFAWRLNLPLKLRREQRVHCVLCLWDMQADELLFAELKRLHRQGKPIVMVMVETVQRPSGTETHLHLEPHPEEWI